MSKRILNCRNHLFDSISRQKLQGVVKGPDFEKESKMDGCYLPAFIRYARGQFMTSLEGALRENEQNSGELDGLLDLWFEDNRLFFLSGLYGIMSSSEPIQNYDVLLDGKPADHWKKNQNTLTDFLLESISKDSVLLDCCGERHYSELLNWDKIGAEGFTVLHAIDPDREGGQVRAASGALASVVNEEKVKQMINGGTFQDLNANIKFVSNDEFKKLPVDNKSSSLPKVGVISRCPGEYDLLSRYAIRRKWDKCFKFDELIKVEDVIDAQKNGTSQFILILDKGPEYDSHSRVREWFGGKDPEEVIKKGLIKVKYHALNKLTLMFREFKA